MLVVVRPTRKSQTTRQKRSLTPGRSTLQTRQADPYEQCHCPQLPRDWPIAHLKFRNTIVFSSPCVRSLPSQHVRPLHAQLRATNCILRCNGEIQQAFHVVQPSILKLECRMLAPIHRVPSQDLGPQSAHVTRLAGLCPQQKHTNKLLPSPSEMINSRASPQLFLHSTCLSLCTSNSLLSIFNSRFRTSAARRHISTLSPE